MNDLLYLSLRTVLGFITLLILMKFMGKREIGQLSLFDLIILLSIADIMVYGLNDFKQNILFSLLPMVIVAILQKLIAYFCLKKRFIRSLFDGNIAYIIKDGKIDLKVMKKNRYNMDDLFCQLREYEIKCPEEVELAILEANGKLSVFKKETSNRYSYPLIVCGVYLDDFIALSKVNKSDISSFINKEQLNIDKIMYLYKKNDEFVYLLNN